MAERYLHTNSVELEALKAKANNENTNKSTKYWLKVWQDWALVRQYDAEIENYPPEELDNANNKQIIMRCCSYNLGLIILVMFGNFAKSDSPRRLVQFWQNFQTSLVLLIPNCTRHRMITYTNSLANTFDIKSIASVFHLKEFTKIIPASLFAYFNGNQYKPFS